MSPPLPPADEEFVNSLHQSPLTISSQDGNDTATPGQPDQRWLTSPELCLKDETFTPEAFLQVNELLLANPNLNSTHVFRADILFDSLGQLMSPEEENRRCYGNDIDDDDASHDHTHDHDHDVDHQSSSTEDILPAWTVDGFDLTRTVLRRFIPRKQKLDAPLDQTCHFYQSNPAAQAAAHKSKEEQFLLVLRPHASSPDDIPWYHPKLRALAFLYSYHPTPKGTKKGDLSIHFLPFHFPPTSLPLSSRLQRTLLSLLKTHARLSRKPLKNHGLRTNQQETRTPKDNILPQHVVQNRYAILKEKYAPWLMAHWVETTEPSKHVFEDLGIAAFLCELWGKVYAGPGNQQEREGKQRKGKKKKRFPGFVDVACGNGVLVYILHQEGYEGWGFDARGRKTWAVLPRETQERLREMIYVPRPFQDAAAAVAAGPEFERTADAEADAGAFFDGVFTGETFIISNHADELTLWTPIIGALSRPTSTSSPLPFLAIPCCSHSLSGARHRFPPPKHDMSDPSKPQDHSPGNDGEQPATGDLNSLAAQRAKERADPGVGYSAYASLTAKLVEIAREVGYGADVEKTLLRIPSTRNIGVVGGIKGEVKEGVGVGDVQERVGEVLRRECRRDGGVGAAAVAWVRRARDLQRPAGRGKGAGGH